MENSSRTTTQRYRSCTWYIYSVTTTRALFATPKSKTLEAFGYMMPAPMQLPPFLAVALQETSGDITPLSLATPPILDLDGKSGGGLEPCAASTSPGSAMYARADDGTQQNKAGTTPAADLSVQALLYSSALRSGAVDALDDGLSSTAALLVPPLNFDMVCGARTTGRGPIYRSGFPNERNYPFLSTLHLRTVVYLAADDVRPTLRRWIDASQGRVQLLHFRLNVNKEPFGEMDQETVAAALRAIVDPGNLPMLIHCNKGKYRVGVITAILRRLQGWSLTSIYDEYVRFAGADRIADEEFIDMFPLDIVRTRDREQKADAAKQWL